MKVTASEIEGSQVVLEMEIEPERVEKAMERAYRRLVSQVNVPGFRRGKAPRVLVERLVGRDTLMNEALKILVPEAYEEAVRDAGIDPVDNPKLDVVSADLLSVRATVPVRPKIELGDYRAIRQSAETVEVSEEQVERTLESLRESRAQWVPVEREAASGDMVTLDIKARSGDKTFLDQKEAHLILDPARQILAPGVVEQILGTKAGDHKAIDMTLPDDFSEKDLAGQEAIVEVAVAEVKEKQLPEMDDELARSLGDYTSLEQLRAAVRTELESQALAQARRNLEDSVLAAVVDQASLEPPLPWVEEQAEALRKETEESLRRQGLTFEQYLQIRNQTESSYREEALSAARRQVKRLLVLGEVARAEGITVTNEEVATALEQALSGREGKVDAAEREHLQANLRSLLRERKTLARLVEIAEDKSAAGKGSEAGGAEEESTVAEQSQAKEET